MDVINEHAPIKKHYINHMQAPFMNNTLRRSINVNPGTSYGTYMSHVFFCICYIFRICGIVELWCNSTKLRYLLKVSSDQKIYYCELYSIVYGEIIFLNDNQYFYVYL